MSCLGDSTLDFSIQNCGEENEQKPFLGSCLCSVTFAGLQGSSLQYSQTFFFFLAALNHSPFFKTQCLQSNQGNGTKNYEFPLVVSLLLLECYIYLPINKKTRLREKITLIVLKLISFEYFNTFYLGLHLCFVNGNLYLFSHVCIRP